jgi:hypothetical protein
MHYLNFMSSYTESFETVTALFFSGDSRFAFLDVSHPFFPYYQHKLSVYEKLEVPAAATTSVALVGSTSGRMEMDDSSQDVNVMAGAGEDSRDSSDKSSDGSQHENCKQRPKPGEDSLAIILIYLTLGTCSWKQDP